MARKRNQLRKIEIIRDFTKYAAGSVLIKWGDTWVLCTASVSDKVPSFLRDTGKGWVTAEYSMLPGSTLERKERDIKKLKPDARGSEISRLIGRSLRAAVDMSKLESLFFRGYESTVKALEENGYSRVLPKEEIAFPKVKESNSKFKIHHYARKILHS